METTERWITVKEACQLVSLSEQSLYAAIRERKFPAIHIGRRIRIDPASLREWVSTHSSAGEPVKTDIDRLALLTPTKAKATAKVRSRKK